MPWIEANGAALRYDIAGTGPRTIVLDLLADAPAWLVDSSREV